MFQWSSITNNFRLRLARELKRVIQNSEPSLARKLSDIARDLDLHRVSSVYAAYMLGMLMITASLVLGATVVYVRKFAQIFQKDAKGNTEIANAFHGIGKIFLLTAGPIAISIGAMIKIARNNKDFAEEEVRVFVRKLLSSETHARKTEMSRLAIQILEASILPGQEDLIFVAASEAVKSVYRQADVATAVIEESMLRATSLKLKLGTAAVCGAITSASPEQIQEVAAASVRTAIELFGRVEEPLLLIFESILVKIAATTQASSKKKIIDATVFEMVRNIELNQQGPMSRGAVIAVTMAAPSRGKLIWAEIAAEAAVRGCTAYAVTKWARCATEAKKRQFAAHVAEVARATYSAVAEVRAALDSAHEITAKLFGPSTTFSLINPFPDRRDRHFTNPRVAQITAHQAMLARAQMVVDRADQARREFVRLANSHPAPMCPIELTVAEPFVPIFSASPIRSGGPAAASAAAHVGAADCSHEITVHIDAHKGLSPGIAAGAGSGIKEDDSASASLSDTCLSTTDAALGGPGANQGGSSSSHVPNMTVRCVHQIIYDNPVLNDSAALTAAYQIGGIDALNSLIDFGAARMRRSASATEGDIMVAIQNMVDSTEVTEQTDDQQARMLFLFDALEQIRSQNFFLPFGHFPGKFDDDGTGPGGNGHDSVASHDSSEVVGNTTAQNTTVSGENNGF